MTPRVVIGGGGVAGIESALALRDLAGEKLEVELHCPRREFLYRPYAVGEPFRSAEVRQYDLAKIAERAGFELKLSSLKSVDPTEKRISTFDEELDYDHLIIATGTKLFWSIPGVTIFWGGPDEFDSELVVRHLGDKGLKRLIFTMPAGRSWSLPLYELALLASSRLREGDATRETRLMIVTPEEDPLRIFGKEVSGQIKQLLADREIELVPSTHPKKFEAKHLTVAPGEPIYADAVISLPHIEGRRVEGIPHDDQGFIPTDYHGRVQGLDDVYAAGDVTAFPVKQGGLASQQADAIAEVIAASVEPDIDPHPFDPVLRGVLWTGEGNKYLLGRLAPGHGEPSTLTDEPPWPEQEGKIISRYLSNFLTEEAPA
jgi:sulfide:quinone oxidoreductase